MKIKVLTHALVLLLTVYVTLAFARQPVIITVLKDVVEDDLDSFNIYNGDDLVANIKADVTPWVWKGEITLINGQAVITATALDRAGNESERSPAALFDPPPSAPAVTVEIKVEVEQ
ncbi:MAG: hypothetical protein OCU18_03725 [Candidatus Syntrophoarchaeum sp.]|nr:hypothetical protein [Candidatus Syntrophoarchaeum sp.]